MFLLGAGGESSASVVGAGGVGIVEVQTVVALHSPDEGDRLAAGIMIAQPLATFDVPGGQRPVFTEQLQFLTRS